MKPLKAKEVRQLFKKFYDVWGAKMEPFGVWFRTPKGELRLISDDFREFDGGNLNINAVGVYFAEENPDGIRLSIEGSQIVGPHAEKNIVKLDEKKFRHWMHGLDISTNETSDNYVLVSNGKDFAGCSKIKSGKLLNYYPKVRRISLE